MNRLELPCAGQDQDGEPSYDLKMFPGIISLTIQAFSNWRRSTCVKFIHGKAFRMRLAQPSWAELKAFLMVRRGLHLESLAISLMYTDKC